MNRFQKFVAEERGRESLTEPQRNSNAARFTTFNSRHPSYPRLKSRYDTRRSRTLKKFHQRFDKHVHAHSGRFEARQWRQHQNSRLSGTNHNLTEPETKTDPPDMAINQNRAADEMTRFRVPFPTPGAVPKGLTDANPHKVTEDVADTANMEAKTADSSEASEAPSDPENQEMDPIVGWGDAIDDLNSSVECVSNIDDIISFCSSDSDWNTESESDSCNDFILVDIDSL